MWKRNIVSLFALMALCLLGARVGIPGLRVAASDVIAACSVLAAFLVQVILLLATVLTPGRLSPSLFRRLAEELDQKQKEAFVLFLIYLATVFGFLGIKLSDAWVPSGWIARDLSKAAAAACSGALGLAALRTIVFLETMRHLQTLRYKLLREDVEYQSNLADRTVPIILQDDQKEAHTPPFGAPVE